MRVTKVRRTSATQWQVFVVERHLPTYESEGPVGVVKLEGVAFVAYQGDGITGTGLKFDSLYDAATALANAVVL